MKYKNILIIPFFSILSLILTIYILGINNLSFVSTEWLAAHDVSTDIISWKFFKDDIWRFPLGSNPQLRHGYWKRDCIFRLSSNNGNHF